jgi:hypothetical protein
MYTVSMTWVALAFTFGLAPEGEEVKTAWIKNYDDARAQARKTGKPIFLVFRCER